MSGQQRVLLIDDNPGTRLLVKGVLTRDLNVPVVEVDTALDGLEYLEKERFLFVLLELALPTMSGVRLLELIRQSPTLAATPVIALTSRGDEATIRRVIELGVIGVIARPLDRTKLAERLLSYIGRLGAPPAQTSAPSRVSADTVLIADGDANFRHFVTSTLKGGRRILSAATGVDALKLALSHGPDVALIGQDLGVLRSDVLAMEMRGQTKLRSTRIFAVTPKGQLDSSLVHYDGVITRTFIPDTFREQFNRLTEPGGPVVRLLHEYPAMHANIASAVEQICGMMMDTEVTELPGHPGLSGGVIEATQVLTTSSGELVFHVSVASDTGSARLIAARLVGGEPDQVTEDDIGSSIREMVNIVTGRLRSSMEERGATVTCGLPTLRPPPPSPVGKAAPDADVLELYFGSSDGAITLEVRLWPPTAGAPA